MSVQHDSDKLWQTIRDEVREFSEREPTLASYYYANVLSHPSLGSALSFHLATRLGCDSVPEMTLSEVFTAAMADDPAILEAVVADIYAVYERDPACNHYVLPVLFFKGFQAVQAYRFAHWLWRKSRRSLALFLQNRISTTLDVDIHPAAQLGKGIMVDHATGVVIGETARVGDNVSLLHGVTLGGSGTGHRPRHPQVGDGVLISVGAKLLGNITIGEGAKIAGGSLVVSDVPPHVTVAGVPAKVVGKPAHYAPSLDMDHGM
ncbi:serine O-acetyltransferase [Litorivivens lipolytica]|uniref:Serine acetyltransferase n=1 Tax=Litorivivens lipolytica TaxID=1524264 RepID=A0A7W4W5L3_9GAMM|nr:serine O-acetyltransferase [Litorivivens lipolytica]MBB3047887.1 serine O-acetyltransferase [Litorivivens lipolytica]